MGSTDSRQISTSAKSTAKALMNPTNNLLRLTPSEEVIIYPPLSYTPITGGTSGIRVLTMSNEEDFGTSEGTITCTLEEVNLNDWTLDYRNSPAGQLQDETIHNSHIYHYYMWYAHCVSENDQSLTDDIEKVLKTDYNVPMEDLKSLENRFNWGDFVALSYVWGDSTQMCPITVNGCRLDVTINLYNALNRFKNSPEAKVRKLKIWVDAICINQSDLDERATEVPKMAKIYSEALFVRAWIGKVSEDVNNNLFVVKEHLKMLKGIPHSDITQDVVSDPNVAHSFIIANLCLARQPYWMRLWVIQEVAIAASTLFWLGAHSFTPKELVLIDKVGEQVPFGVLDKLLNVHERADYHADHITMLQRRRGLELGASPSSKLVNKRSLSYVLALAQYSQATDPRDKVYGILALLPKEISEQVIADYKATNTVCNAYVNFSRICFLQEGNSNLLCEVRHYPKRPQNEPSWAVLKDNNNGDEHVSGFDIEVVDAGYTNRNSYKAGSGLQLSISFSNDNRLLSCTGAFIDVVNHLGESAAEIRYHALSVELGDLWWTPNWQQKPSYSRAMDERRLSEAIFNDHQRHSVERMLRSEDSGSEAHEVSVLDIPWLEVEDLGEHNPGGAFLSNDVDFEYATLGTEEEWAHLSTHSSIQVLFRHFLHPNAELPIFGVPLRKYFQSTERFCSNPEGTLRCAAATLVKFLHRRPLVTQQGRTGFTSIFTLPGDRIAVLAGCDMPLVLRTQGDCFEVVGPCNLEGVMNGEVGKSFEEGKTVLESTKLC